MCPFTEKFTVVIFSIVVSHKVLLYPFINHDLYKLLINQNLWYRPVSLVVLTKNKNNLLSVL